MNQVIQYYDKIATSYDADRFGNSYGRFIDAQERKVLNHLLADRQEIVLDLACGSGRLLSYANIGLDASAEMLKLASEKFPGKPTLHAEADAIPLGAASLDTVISFHFFMHLDHAGVAKIVSEVHRVLKDEGRLIFDIPSGKRRKLLGYTTDTWHGAHSATLEDITQMVQDKFVVKSSYGLLLLPVHRIPKRIRRFCIWLDYLLANSFLKEYSSYLILELRKK